MQTNCEDVGFFFLMFLWYFWVLYTQCIVVGVAISHSENRWPWK